MAHELKTIHVDSETDLFAVLAEASAEPIHLEKDGVVYRLVREREDIWRDYDPDAVRAALRKYAGTITLEEGEELKKYVRRAREEGTRPADRP
jgi:hypothetical protein